MSSKETKICFYPTFIIGLFACLSVFGEELNATTQEVIPLRIIDIDLPARSVWSATVADFDNDGSTDFFIGGHVNLSGYDTIYYRRGDAYVASTFRFPWVKDRHACAAGDVNGDGWLDLYCTTGATEGTRLNPNELWMGVDGTAFRKLQREFGAEDPSGRGRLTSFLNFNGDDKPDLFVSVWGKRADAALNESSVYVNQGGKFERVLTSITGEWGGRCQAVVDINNDGFDDLVVCSAKVGGKVFLNNGVNDFVEIALHGSGRQDAKKIDEWWNDVKFADLNGDHYQDLIKLSGSGMIEIRLGSSSNVDFPKLHKEISTKAIGDPVSHKYFASNLALSDLNRDGHVDIYVTRRMGPGRHSMGGDAPDLVLFGPDFTTHQTIPMASAGQGYLSYALENSFLRLNAGEKWDGSVQIVSAKPINQAPQE